MPSTARNHHAATTAPAPAHREATSRSTRGRPALGAAPPSPVEPNHHSNGPATVHSRVRIRSSPRSAGRRFSDDALTLCPFSHAGVGRPSFFLDALRQQ
ncbi:hypothetical protein ACFFX0_07105 [Citricoccus parietis]|uniref:Uncharacterized protein n=1 Tax=Citricoccus parietis TaxID=592307 RepID=A0ABV5FWD5_9MICC